MVFSVACGTEAEAPVVENANIIEKSEPVEVSPAFEGTVSESALNYFINKPADSYLIAAPDVFAAIDNEEDIFILDIRQADVYAEGHLKGAVNVPWGTDFADSIAKLPGDKVVYLYCYTGQTAGQTVALLNTLGYDVKSIKYGFNLGVSKTEGFESYIETQANDFASDSKLSYNTEIFEAVSAYYTNLSGATFGNYIIPMESAVEFVGTENAYFIDIRKSSDFDLGHIETATNMPYGTGIIEYFGAIPTDKPVIVNCYSGQTSGQTVAILRLLGYDAYSLKYGMGTPVNAPGGWKTNDYPLVSTAYDAAKDVFATKPAHSYLIAGEEVLTAIDSQEDMTILDIRKASDYEAGHLMGAVNIPWGPTFGENLASIPMDKPLYINCYSGQTAGQAVAMLNMLGYDARSIKYGWSFGISKIEGIENYTELGVNALGVASTEFNEVTKASFDVYFESLASATIGNNIISEASAFEISNNNDGTTLFVDIRKADDYAIGHIEGAISMPYGTELMKDLSALDNYDLIVVNCYSGQTAGQAVAIMRALGYNAVSLKGGMGTAGNAPLGWGNNGFALVQ